MILIPKRNPDQNNLASSNQAEKQEEALEITKGKSTQNKINNIDIANETVRAGSPLNYVREKRKTVLTTTNNDK